LVILADAVGVLRVEVGDSLKAMWACFLERVGLHIALSVIWYLLARMTQMLHVCLRRRGEWWTASGDFLGSGKFEANQITLW